MPRPTVMTPEVIAVDYVHELLYVLGAFGNTKILKRQMTSQLTSDMHKIGLEAYMLAKEYMWWIIPRVNTKVICIHCKQDQSTLAFRKRSRHCIGCEELHIELSKLGAQESRRKRKALQKTTADGSITRKALRGLLIRQDYKCAACTSELQKKHLDHIMPLSRGGKHILTNVQWLCPKCNMTKHNKVGWVYGR